MQPEWTFAVERIRILDEPIRNLPRLLFGVGVCDLEPSCRMVQVGPIVLSLEAIDGGPAHWRWVTTWAADRASSPLRIAGMAALGVSAVVTSLAMDAAMTLRGWR
jgi:uncharacterized protein YjeT (DUF2065 family)